MAQAKKPPAPPPHHGVRTFVAAILGFLAMTLVSASILLVWANRTLTDTSTYVQTVGPLIERPELQNFVAGRMSDQLLQELSDALLPARQAVTETPEQLKPQITAVIHDSVVQILQSPAIQQLWLNTNRSSHAELVKQLDAGATEVTFDFGPLVSGVVDQMKQTKLAPMADKIQLSPADAKISIKGGALERVRRYYLDLKAATVTVVALALLLLALSVWVSVHHLKTLRRMLVGTGVSALLAASVIAFAAKVPLSSPDPATAKLAVAILQTLLHPLLVGCLILGVVCVGLALASKAYEHYASSSRGISPVKS
jgi:hypothetical protein